MTTVPDPFEAIEQRGEADKQSAAQAQRAHEQQQSAALLGTLVQKEQYLGETLRMDFRNVTVQVHDHQRRLVGGIPHLSYLVASRLQPWMNPLEWAEEDSSVLLLRVLGAAPTPSDMLDTIVRSEAARRAVGNETSHWDTKDFMDGYTRHQLSFAGLACEVVGTFYLGRKNNEKNGELELRFGTDINNFYPNKGLKVYKPIDDALHIIANFRDPSLTPQHDLKDFTVPIGHVRYASTDRPMQGIDGVSVSVPPVDMLAQRTALFGMSRTGKSNTTKIIARAIFNLRYATPTPMRVGQIIFDYNGEYANENMQGSEDMRANALKNVWEEHGGIRDDVVTYGLSRPETDLDRKLLQVNAYGNDVRDWSDPKTTAEDLDMLQVGKVILNDLLAEDPAKYIKNFCEVDLSVPEGLKDYGIRTRFQRQVLVYRALLKRGDLTLPPALATLSRSILNGPNGKSLFNAKLLTRMRENGNPNYASAADILDETKRGKLTWDMLGNAFEHLAQFINEKDSGYAEFNAEYLTGSSSGQAWADSTLTRLLEMFRYPNGAKAVARLQPYHEENNTKDFAQQIYEELLEGKLVIVDQGGGDPELNNAAARRIMWSIFRGNQKEFTSGNKPRDILVYVEEAHNLLPNSSSLDLKDVWVRTAKEGSKYRIGLVYATQEVSSIQKNILKNTANWFISHLNNTDETKELRKFYDFANFEDSILRAQNRGFLRVKMLSNPYINPVQIQRFLLDLPKTGAPAATTDEGGTGAVQ